MSNRVLIAIVVIVLIIVGGMVLTMKRSMQTGVHYRDPDALAPRTTPPPQQKP